MEHKIKEFDSLIDLLDDLDREGITGMQKRQQMEQFLLRKARLQGRPYCASFELTPLCNFDCKMCYMHLTQEQAEREGKILTTAQWLDIVRQAVDAGVTNVDLTGGECLTHPGFPEIYAYLVSRGVHVSVLTNGQLINEKILQLFRQYPPVVVQISLYGSTPEAYKRVTGRDAFADVTGNIAKLKEAGIEVSLSLTPNRFMQEDVEGLLDLLHSLNLRYRIGSTTLPARPETGRDIDDYIADNETYIRISKMENRYRQNMARLYPGQEEKIFSFRIRGQEEFTGPGCSSGSANFHVNWKGEMTPCIAFYTVVKSLIDCPLEEAWQWIRKTMQSYHPPAECDECTDRDNCTGCPAEKTAGILNGPLNCRVCKRCADLKISEPTECIQGTRFQD